MPILIMMVGLPATGKSTRVAALAAMNPDVFVYSIDTYIERCAKQNGWTYDQAFADFIKPATKYMNEMLDIAMRSKQDIVWDQTNLGVKKRAKIINRVRQAGYNVECECIVPPLDEDAADEWLRRLQARPGKTIPDNIMSDMMDRYVKPTVEEGFDSVHYFDMYGNLID